LVTLSPVVVWMKIRLIVTLAIIHKWETRQIDFELAYPQAEVKEMYMRLPKGFKLGHSGIQDTHVLKLLKNIYGLKQVGRVWNKHLHKRRNDLGYQQSKVDPCLYYRSASILALYFSYEWQRRYEKGR